MNFSSSHRRQLVVMQRLLKREMWHHRSGRGNKSVDLRRATVFCLGHCLSKHKMTRNAKNLGVMATLAHPAHLCRRRFVLRQSGVEVFLLVSKRNLFTDDCLHFRAGTVDLFWSFRSELPWRPVLFNKGKRKYLITMAVTLKELNQYILHAFLFRQWLILVHIFYCDCAQ